MRRDHDNRATINWSPKLGRVLEAVVAPLLGISQLNGIERPTALAIDITVTHSHNVRAPTVVNLFEAHSGKALSERVLLVEFDLLQRDDIRRSDLR